MQKRSSEKTVSLYPRFIFFLNCHFWAPVFFLYFVSRFTVSQVFLLEAVYYFSVSVLEVPSGYFSDRLNRKLTLLLAICFLAVACLLFFCGNLFFVFILGQISMAAGFAFVSGTDTALHYEALKRLGREAEYPTREAAAGGMAFLAGALSAVIGGIAGSYSLPLVYLFTFFSLAGALACVYRMDDPGRGDPASPSLTFPAQVKVLLHKALGRELRPVFLFAVFMTVLVHIPYEFYQPYLKNIPGAFGKAGPIGTGFHLAATMLAGAWSTRYITRLTKHYGAWSVLFTMTVCLVLLVSMMAISYDGLVAGLLLLRTVPKAIATPIINSLASPRLPDSQRGTYLSLQSLCGRLSYGIVLIVMAVISRFSEDPVKASLTGAAIMGCALVAWVVIEKRICTANGSDTVFKAQSD